MGKEHVLILAKTAAAMYIGTLWAILSKTHLGHPVCDG
jgi:hypothetical protein